jgi:hypothetical protein
MVSSMMSFRIEPALLAALKRRAKAAGRSASAEVVRLIAQAVEVPAAPPARPTMGMFAHREAPTLAELQLARRDASATLRRAAVARARRAR